MNRPENGSTDGVGYLIVQVTTANSAIPLEGAYVTISQSSELGGDVLYELRSGRDGKTPRIALPTVPRAESMSPGNVKPYATYDVATRLRGYRGDVSQRVPIFDGIISIHQANLVPISENQYPDAFSKDKENVYDTPDSAL